MTDYDDPSGLVADEEKIFAMTHKADAQLDHEQGASEDPLQDLTPEALASFNLRRIRKALGLSQQQIADKIAADRPGGQKLSQTQIAKIERGERPWRVNEMMWIANALGVYSDEFFRVTPELDYSRLEIEAARLRYEQAKALAEEARDEWRRAAKTEYQTEEAFVQVAASHNIKTPEVIHSLSMRWFHQTWVEKMLEGPTFDEDERAIRSEAAREYAEAQWEERVRMARQEPKNVEPEGS